MAVAGRSVQFDVEAEVEKILMRFSRIKSVVSNLKKKGRATYTVDLLKEKLAFIKTYWDDAFQRYDALCVHIPASKRLEYSFFKEQQFECGEEQFLEAQSYLASEITKLDTAKRDTATSVPSNEERMSSDSTPIPLELPRQNLPRFGGELRKWFHFEDVFTSTIIRNNRLSDVQRLQYLNACVEGEPLAMIESLDIVGQNFDVAWQILKARYGKRLLVIEQLLDSVYDLKPIRRGDLASIKQVTVYLRQTLNALDKLDRPVNQYGDLLIAYIKKLFDDELKREWRKIVVKAQEYPSFEDILKFLEDYEDTYLQPLATPRRTQANVQSNAQVRAHNAVPVASAVQSKSCGFCPASHDATQCRNFLSMTPEQRYYCIKGSQKCVLCLNDGHAGNSCQSSLVCQKCRGKHHTLLHFGNTNQGAGKRRPEKKAAASKRDAKRDRTPPRASTGSAGDPATSSTV